MPDPSFSVTADDPVGESLLVGLTHPGIAGLSAVDHLVKHLDFEAIGHVETSGLPSIAPFEDGVPRQPLRLYTGEGVTVLVGETFLPLSVAEPFTGALFEWLAATPLEEVALLHGIPYPHGPEDHDVSVVATPDYRERRLGEHDIRTATGGFFDGVVGESLLRGLDPDQPAVGTFVTPSHPPGPDLEAALRLLDAIQRVYDLEVAEEALAAQIERMRAYYDELAERMTSMEETAPREFSEDRMYM
jgi:uncharacterized protein